MWLVLAAVVAWGQEPVRVNAGSVDRAIVEQRLENLKTKVADRRAALEAEFRDAGCERIGSQNVWHSKLGNLICTLPSDGPRTILVGAHFDFVDIGKGAVDDWSGAALLPSLYQSLAAEPRRHTFVFVGFDAEETGLWGSKAYAQKMTKEERAGLRAMVNVECIGMSPTAIWGHRADKLLANSYVRVAHALNLPAGSTNVEKVGDDDSHSFLNLKIPVITFHSTTQQNWNILHSVNDNLKAIDRQQYYDAYRLISLYLAYIDTTLD